MSNKARRRQKLTGEKYQTALMHLRHQCRQCRDGKPCEACNIDPCWTCRPECTVRTAKEQTAGPPKCVYGADRRCTHCGKLWHRYKPAGNYTIQSTYNVRPLSKETIQAIVNSQRAMEHCPVFPGDTKIDIKTDPVVKALQDNISEHGVKVPESVRVRTVKPHQKRFESSSCIHRSVTDYTCNGCGATVGWPTS